MLTAGAQVAGYHIERLLGRGGMGTVYLATQVSLNRLVALKMLPRELAEDVAFRTRFAREGEVQAALDHPHIVPVHEAGQSDEGLFLAMRYVRGSTLKELIVAGELDPARTIRLLTPIAAALDAAHAAALIHRDVKPQNILVDLNDWPYLADFGLTRSGGSAGLTRTGALVGTLDYIAPEQVQGRPASARSDQYALAAVLYECLAGEVPFPSDSDAALLYAQVHVEPPSISERAGDIPAAFDAVLHRGLAKDPDDRFPSVGAMMAAAGAALTDGTPAASAPTVSVVSPAPASAPAAANGASAPSGQAVGRETVISSATPAPVSRPRSSPSRELPRAAIPIAAGVLAVVGFALGSALGSGDEVAARAVAAGPVATISISGPVRSAPVPAALGLSRAKAYTLGKDGHALLVTGEGRAAGPRLLPDGAVDDAAAGVTPALVKVGSAQGLRFEGLRVTDLAGRTAAVVVPSATTSSVALCAAAGSSDAERCAAALGSLTVRSGAKTVAVAPPAAFGTDLRRALTRYDGRRRAAQRALREARRPSSQAAAAAQLATAAGTLASSARKLEDHPASAPARARIVAAATDVQQAAGALARAARRGDRAAYASARSRLASAEQRLRAAVIATRSLRIQD